MLAFPLKPQLVENDYPMWEDIDDDMLKVILDKEKNEGIDYYIDIADDNLNYSMHKIGGNPSIIQGKVDFSEGYQYVMQITSDDKAKFNIVDSGNFYFAYNPEKNDWEVYCDFY